MNYETILDDDNERRRAFIAKWRQGQEEKANAESGVKLNEMDARKCKGELKGLVQGALESHLANLKAEIAANPPQASTRLLVMLGIDPFGRGLGNGSPPEPPIINRFDDALP